MTVKKLIKHATGILGFDAITNGGLPDGGITLLLGGAGSGKTVFALQTLVNVARSSGEPGIFVAFEEAPEKIAINAESFGWNLSELLGNKIFLLNAMISSENILCGQFDLSGLLASLGAKVEEMGARWIVFDAIDALLTLLNDHTAEMRELYRLREWVAGQGLTGIVTAKLDESEFFRLRYSTLQFLADCSVRLENCLLEQVSLREMRVVKYRGSAFAENLAYFVIGSTGIEVSDINPVGDMPSVSNERISSGVARLDTMLAGGYFRGSTVLLTGLPGTAKTTLASAFAEAACNRGERVLYCAFDEPPPEIVRNLTSVNIHLARHMETGLLTMVGVRTDNGSSEEHYIQIVGLIDQHQPTCVAVDPFSTLLRAGGNILAISVVRRLVTLAKRRGITLMLTALQEAGSFGQQISQLHASTIADTWINISYHEVSGERNRALSIIKSRGSAHSNQVRELVLSQEGVTLNDVYTSSGGVLMGTLRWESEEQERRDHLRERQLREAKRRELDLALEEAQSKLSILQHELALRREEIAIFEAESAEILQRQQDRENKRSRLRGAD